MTFFRALPALAVLCGGWPARADSIGSSLTTAEKRGLEREARLVVDLLQNYHYSGGSFREIENKEMVARFLEELDPANDFLTIDDVEFIHQRFDHSLKSVYLLRGDLQPAFEIFDLFANRARERLAWIKQRLDRDFDFTIDENYVEHRPHDPPGELLPSDRRWELRLREEVLGEILAGRDFAAAKAAVARRYAEIRRQIAAVDSLAVRERFFDSVIRSFDPHSGYFSADSAREFAIGMANAVAGIGLDLRKENGQCVVSAVQPGGPADLHSDIQPGDIIEELGDNAGPRIDASHKPLRELVALVRGEPGTKLQLTYHPPGTDRSVDVTLERTRVLLGAERARGAISVVPGQERADHKIGWIVLPSFYAAGEGAAATSATRDVRELLDQMVAKGIDGLVLDLRANPGGALSEAVALSELFLHQGRVMVSCSLDGPPVYHDLKEGTPVFTGPFVILTSSESASASEIFAGAMKFHHRAVIVGAASTFGKGTMQNYIELAKAQPGLPAGEMADWGTLRLTLERFFLPDGGPVQRVGIPSNIVLPDYETGAGSREADLPLALPAESITLPDKPTMPPAGPSAISEARLHQLNDLADADARQLPEWSLWRQEQQAWQVYRDRRVFSLRLETRQAERSRLLADYATRLRSRRQLTTQSAFVTEPLELALLQPSLAAHEAKLRAGKTGDGAALMHHLNHGAFTVETDGGHLRSLRLDTIDFREFAGDAAELAAAFSAGAGFTAAPGETKLALQDVALLEHRTDGAVLACFATRLAGGTLTPGQVRQGTEQLLRRATEIDGDMLRERPALDVPRRECLRLAADWADWPVLTGPKATAP